MLTSEQARQKLTPYKEGWLLLGCHHGHPFIGEAARQLLDDVRLPNGAYWVRADLLKSAMARGDAETCRIFINDWMHEGGWPSKTVSKFVPGDHYHVLDTKFDTLDEAIRYLHSKGYQYAGLNERYVYRSE